MPARRTAAPRPPSATPDRPVARRSPQGPASGADAGPGVDRVAGQRQVVVSDSGRVAGLDPPRAARRVAATWRRLATPAGTPRSFWPVSDPLPSPVQRWLTRAVAPDAPTSSAAVLEMSGRIRVGSWRAFTARQVLAADRGFVWAAVARFGAFPVLGYDAYAQDEDVAEMRWRLAGVLPVATASGEDVRRSAAGRLAGELVLNPGAALAPHVRWEAVDHVHARAHVALGGAEHVATVAVDDDGTLRSVRLPRWGDPDGTGSALHEFEARCTGDRTFTGYRLPAHVAAGWDLDAPGSEPFIEFDVDGARFL